ncbi:hypothetical protein [Achromobacter xylosoxidans]|uniref:hypothetical protein n=1 Tax=Alcaligenes xylosoxydans xylosoxydans TaxID=85698 RepID=UPI001F147891
MSTPTPSLVNPTMSSKWDGLSPHLIASFWPVERAGSGSHYWRKIEGQPTIMAPLMDANIEMTLGWQSPFENAGADKGVPAISSMLQSGAIQPWVGSEKGKDFVGKFEGRTGITKLNSTQVFAGMPPVKITAIALFRAWRDPYKEVMEPVNMLIQWALPQELAPDGPIMSLLSAAKEIAQGKPLDEASARALLPSIAPSKLAMKYKGVLYSPMVIESIGYPIGSPVDKNGNHVELAVPLTLCSLAAIDRSDWRGAIGGQQGFTV